MLSRCSLSVGRSLARINALQCRHIRQKRPFPGTHDRKSKRLDVVLLGKPNSGKSVILNNLLQTKLAATSRKRHTTRSQILGVFNFKQTQLAFYDTPGFIPSMDAKKAETRRMRDITTSAVSAADVVLLVVDASKTMSKADMTGFAEMVQLAMEGAKQEVLLVLNKIDLVTHKTELLDLSWDLVSVVNGFKLRPENQDAASLDTTTFMISATENDGVTDMKNYLLALAKPKPWVIGKDQGVSDMSEEDIVEEIMREHLLDHTHEEIPYIAGIECKSFSEMTNKKIRIDVDIQVDSHRQQKIVVGEQGRTMVKIRQSAVEAFEKIFDKQVMLYIWVNVRSKHSSMDEEPSALV
jgi:GTPase